MRFRLVPRDEGFFPLFDEAARNITECARRLRSAVTDFDDLEGKRELLHECEHLGDQITAQILARLASSFVTPFDREDIHELTELLDDVVDDMQASVDLLVLHSVREPLPEIAELADVLLKSAEANETLLQKLPRLRGMEADLAAIDRLESEADGIYRRLVAHLFSGEFEALEVLKWKDVIEAIEAAVNTIEKVSDIVEGIALKHS